MRLTRQQSMNRAFQFARVRQKGTSVAGRFIVISAMRLPQDADPSLFGIICTRKVAKKAVVRNKLKRRVRELIRAHGEPFCRGFMIVCVLRWRAVDAEFTDVEKDWKKTANRLLKQIRQAHQEQQNAAAPHEIVD